MRPTIHRWVTRIVRALLTRLVAVVFCSGFPHGAAGQCGVILQDEAPASDGRGYFCLHEFDFDGPGPLAPELVVGGDTGRVLAFNGTRWRQVGPRLSGPAFPPGEPNIVYRLLTFRGDLYAVAGSLFSLSNGSGLFRWNGATWTQVPFSPTACGAASVATGYMINGTVWSDQIVVTGQSLRCGGTSALALAWDGVRWSPVGNAFASAPDAAIVSAAIGTRDGRLLIGGSIPVSPANVLIAELVGGLWTARVSGSSASPFAISAFQEFDDQVFAMTRRISVPALGAPLIGVLREAQPGAWERWFPVGAESSLADWGYHLFRDGDRTFLSGVRGGLSGVVLVRAADGPWINAMIDGIEPERVRGVARVRNRLVAVGSNSEFNCQHVSSVSLAAVEAPLLFQAAPSRFARPPGETQILGAVAATPVGPFVWPAGRSSSFSVAVGQSGPGGSTCPTSANIPARLDRDWTNPQHLTSLRTILTAGNGDVLAFGGFNSVGGQPITAGAARWTPTGWVSFLAPLTIDVTSAVLHAGDIHAVERPASGSIVRRWNGSAWQAVGTTFAGVTVRLVSTGPDLYAFVPGSTTSYRLQGSAWSLLPVSPVRIDVATDAAGQLVVGSSVAAAQPVARFTGSAWESLPAFTVPLGVEVLRSQASHLYAGLGWGPSAPTLAPLMRLEGASWVPAISTQAPNAGVPHATVVIYDMAVEGDTLHLVGRFPYLAAQTAESWARFYTGPPRVLTAPLPVQVSRCGTAYFSAEPEVYHDPAQTYHWTRDGRPLNDGPLPSGAAICGARTLYLRLAGVRPTDAGAYSLILTNGCGATATPPVGLSVCAAEFNCDGDLNADDLSDFITCYFGAAACFDADFNADGEVNADDLSDFITAYFAGCPA